MAARQKTCNWTFNSSVTPKPTCNRYLLLLIALSMYNAQQRNATVIETAFRQTNFKKAKACESIFNGNSRKTEVWQFSSVPTLPKSSAATASDFLWLTAPSQSLEISCLETGNQFAFTEHNCGLLQNVIQQPPFCLLTDLLLLEGYHLIAY